ncbi:putative ubiquitin system component CUE, UBA-like superfamily [Helianthus annuus]|nr:putative ubiquitin system component CUE, UBA-like superfamily [Helianthus annuus]
MSNHQRYSSKNKTHQQRFVPKSSQPLNQNPNPNPTLSDSLRKQQSLSSSRPQSGDDGGSFVNYLPQDEAVAAGLGAEEGGLDPVESQRVVDLLNRECSRLLKLNAKDFWKQVASDTSLHAFLESFLKYRSRWYDFPYRGAKGIVAGVIVGEHELNRRVFMILYRMSSNRDPGAKASDSLSARDHAVILQEKKLLDLPKLLDICAIYGHENEDLTRSIVTNAIKAQPLIHDSFTDAISHFLNIVHTMYERCTTSLEVLFSSREAQDNSFTQLQRDYLEIMDFINDAIVSMDALVTAYNHAAVYFSSPVETSYGSDEMVKIFARLHDSLLPALQQGFRIIFTAEKDKLAEVFVSLKMLASRIVKFSWNLLNFSYLSEEVFNESVYFPSSSKIFPAQVEDPVIRSDILVQTFREISEECSTVHEGKNAMSLLQSVEKSYQLMSRLELLTNQGWISMDDEQLRFLSGIISVANGANVLLLPSNKVVEMDEDNAITESKISQVKDLFPDYGNGFISACLDVYNDNPEEVIQRILEGTLDKDLQSLDTSLAVLPPKTAAPPVGKKDKGKGKLVEPELDYIPPKPRIEGPSSTSSSAVGRFVRKSTANMPDSEILNSKDETSKSFALKSLLEYEDEYDDSFDDLGLSVGDAGLDDLSEKVTSNEVSASEASKWGSRQKPQFYVKDGKNYSYKVSGSVAAANYNEASIVNQAQKELIHGLGRGGNFPYDEQGGRGRGRGWGRGNIGKEQNVSESNEGEGRGRGRGWGRGNIGKEQNVTESNEGEDSNGGIGERGRGGRGRGGRRGGGRSNNYRKDQAMKKHLSGLGGF